METNWDFCTKNKLKIMDAKKQKEQLPFIEGVFTPTEATDMLTGIIQATQNFCALQKCIEWERNHSVDLSFYNNIIAELQLKGVEIKEQINKPNLHKEKIKIELVLNVQTD